MKFLKLTLCMTVCLIGIVFLAEADPEVSDEIFDLNELEVLGYTLEKPDLVFKVESPQITYYSPPELPNGEIIVALDFIDRYRETLVPGSIKWASIISFPWIDGRERNHVAWLCLYLWNETVYGFSPTAKFDWDRRFVLPISLTRRTVPEELYSLAEKYIEEISPAEIVMKGFEDVEYLEIPAGRIEGWRPIDKNKRGKELISLLYQYEEDPNQKPVLNGAIGPGELYKETNNFWNKYFSFDFSPEPHPFDTARELLKPRWSIRATLIYKKDILFFKDVELKAEVLLFNMGQLIFAYHTSLGVWRTDATLAMISEGRGADRITYPRTTKTMRVILRRWEDQKGEGDR